MGEAGLLRITKAVIEVASGLTNAVQQAGYVARAAQKLGIAETALRAELQHSQSRGRTPMSAPPTRNPPAETGRGDAVRPIKEWALVEHVLADSAHAVWVKKYLPLDLITDPECRKLLDACLRAAETSRDVLSVLRERYPEDMAIQQKATECLATPSKIKSEFATVEESIQLLIIGIRSMALQRRRKEIERQKENAALSAADRKNLEIEYGRLGYDMARLKTWESAAPILEYL